MATNRTLNPPDSPPAPEPTDKPAKRPPRILAPSDPKLAALVKADEALAKLPLADAGWVAAYLAAKYKEAKP